VDIYNTDFVAWLMQQAAALRARQWDQLDVEHLAEEIDGLAALERRELRSRIRFIVTRLISAQQPRPAFRAGPQELIEAEQDALGMLLEDNPTLRAELAAVIHSVYPRARRAAARDLGIAVENLPDHNPFTLEEILGEA
jgi:hypothetical protein